MQNGFVKAVREQVWLKILLSGASGCGKTYSGLRLASGIAKECGSRIAFIGTEGSRDKYYANEFDYDLLQLSAPFSIDTYLEAMDAAVKGGYKVLVIDSLSKEWQWLNEIHDKMPGNSFTNWGKLKPKHNEFTEKILLSPIHVIGTVRGKDEWVIEENSDHKKVPKKVGMGTQADKNITYEYTVSLMIDQSTHVATADKDNTHIFDGRYDILTEEDGVKLYQWANDGIPAQPIPQTQEESNTMDLSDIKKEIIRLCTEKGGTQNQTLMDTLKQFTSNGNPNAIKSTEKAMECLKAVQEVA